MGKLKLHKSTRTAVKKYIEIRYSHWEPSAIKVYIQKVMGELSRRNGYPDEYPNNELAYRTKVKAFFARNQAFLDLHEKSSAEILAKQKAEKEHEEKISKLFDMDDKKRKALIRKHGGNVNSILNEV